jgi:hypothetical protein
MDWSSGMLGWTGWAQGAYAINMHIICMNVHEKCSLNEYELNIYAPCIQLYAFVP